MRRLLTLTCAMVLLGTVFYAEHTPLVPYFAKILGSRSRQRASGAGVLLGVRPTAFAGLGSMSASRPLFRFASGAREPCSGSQRCSEARFPLFSVHMGRNVEPGGAKGLARLRSRQ